MRFARLIEDHGLVFPNQVGKTMNARNLRARSFKPILERAGLPRSVRLHDLRHTCATVLLKRGQHPKFVQELLGHATISQTLDTYSHVPPVWETGWRTRWVMPWASGLQYGYSKRLPAPSRGPFVFQCFATTLGARPAGFEPATGGLEVRDGSTSINNLKRTKPLLKPNSQHLRLLDVSSCLYGLESG